MWDLIHETAQSLRRNRTRTFLTGLAVAWGIFMLILLLGMARGVLNSFDYNMGQNNFEAISIWGGNTTFPYRGYKAGRWIRLRDTDMDRIVAENPHYAKPGSVCQTKSGVTIAYGDKTVGGGYDGVLPSYITFEPMDMIYGRYINQPDIDQRRKVMVLSRNRAEQLFGSADKAVGQHVRCQDLSWLVVGVYDHRWRSTTYVPYSTAKMLAGDSPYVNQMDIPGKNLHNEADAKAFQDGIVATLAAIHQFDKREGDSGGLWMWNRFDSYLSGQQGQAILLHAVWAIGLLTLLTGVVGISNIMFVSVKERTHEIGIRRAIGAKPRSILTSVVTESVAITLIFGYLGIVAGMAATELVKAVVANEEFLRNPGITITMAVEVTAVLVVAGAVAGLFPAIKATKIKPVEALRDE